MNKHLVNSPYAALRVIFASCVMRVKCWSNVRHAHDYQLRQRGYVFTPVPLFVSKITQKLLDRFPQNMVKVCGMMYSVQIQTKGQIQDLFYHFLYHCEILWGFIYIFLHVSENNSGLLMNKIRQFRRAIFMNVGSTVMQWLSARRSQLVS